MSAIGNYWGNNDATHAEDVIYHQTDNSSYGLVTYNPVMELYPDMLDFRILVCNNPQITNFYDEDIVFSFSEYGDTLFYFFGCAVPDLSSIVPTVTIPFGVSCSPNPEEIVNLYNAVTYTLTTPHGTSKDWVVVAYIGGGVDEHNEISVSIVQNPIINNILHLRNESGKAIAVEVHSITGQLVYQAESADNNFTVTTSDWNKGIYLVTVSQDGKRKNFKVVNL